jgi:DNA-binding PadR family transcriptional regulator
MTDGNLCVHMKTLERKGYITKAKELRGGRSLTICELSDNGRQAPKSYLSDLERLVDSVRRPEAE